MYNLDRKNVKFKETIVNGRRRLYGWATVNMEDPLDEFVCRNFEFSKKPLSCWVNYRTGEYNKTYSAYAECSEKDTFNRETAEKIVLLKLTDKFNSFYSRQQKKILRILYMQINNFIDAMNAECDKMTRNIVSRAKELEDVMPEGWYENGIGKE